jgi:hypothetical protein
MTWSASVLPTAFTAFRYWPTAEASPAWNMDGIFFIFMK